MSRRLVKCTIEWSGYADIYIDVPEDLTDDEVTKLADDEGLFMDLYPAEHRSARGVTRLPDDEYVHIVRPPAWSSLGEQEVAAAEWKAWRLEEEPPPDPKAPTEGQRDIFGGEVA